MHRTQSRPLPERIYEPNIIHNPRHWMGIWTPQGWRVHRKRFGDARVVSVALNGDGSTTFFPEALLDPKTRRVEWQDDLHLSDDPFTDHGIYPADPRVEYPAGQPRWAVSHTLLQYPVADHNLYTHEYTWDMVHGHLQTHFRRHVRLEEARTDNRDGMTVEVRHKPLSQTIEGNVHYPLPNSAVRGVWSNPQKAGANHYVRRIIQLFPMHNAVYGISPHVPVVQCYGMWAVYPEDPIADLFDSETRECRDPEQLISRCKIPLDAPKIAMVMPTFKTVRSEVYEGEISVFPRQFVTVGEEHLKLLRERKGSRFELGRVGYALQHSHVGSTLAGVGYAANFDLNDDEVIDDEDERLLSKHLGREIRPNIYLHAYFGGDWLTTNVCLTPEHTPGTPAIASYAYGGGYDAHTGVVRLLNTPGPNKSVWVEYHYDAPADPGDGNIIVHLYQEA